MTSYPTIGRTALLALLGVTLCGAAEFPMAPSAAARLTAAPGPVSDQTLNASDSRLLDQDDVVTADSSPVGVASRPALLVTLVAQTIDRAPTAYGDRDCLARAVYFEARGEPLEGQLAVAQVILNRVASGRFATSVCGVVNQRGQFSFDRSRLPADGRDWRTAKAIAAIAATAAWDVVAPRATAFHATRVAAGWTSLHRVGTIGNHVFYR